MKKIIKVLIVVFILLLILLSGYVVYNNIINNKDDDSNKIIDNDYSVKIDDIELYLEMDKYIVDNDSLNNKISVSGTVFLSYDSDKYTNVSLSGYCLGGNGEKYKVHSGTSNLYANSKEDLVIYEDITQDVEYSDGTTKTWDEVDFDQVKITYCKIDKLNTISNNSKENVKEISFEKEFNDLDNFLNVLNDSKSFASKKASYKNVTIEFVSPQEKLEDNFYGIKFYKNNEEILSLEEYDFHSFLNLDLKTSIVYDLKTSIVYNEKEKVFFVSTQQLGAHKPILIVISEDGDILFNKGWKEGSFFIDKGKWEVTVKYFVVCCGGGPRDVVDGKFTINGEEYSKDDISYGTIVYQYENKEMKIVSHDYKTFGEANPDAFK